GQCGQTQQEVGVGGDTERQVLIGRRVPGQFPAREELVLGGEAADLGRKSLHGSTVGLADVDGLWFATMIRISTKYFWLAFAFALFRPWLIIDGQQVRLNWGDNDIPVAPGVHQLTIWVPYLWKVGEASFTVDTTATGSAQVYYAAPAI